MESGGPLSVAKSLSLLNLCTRIEELQKAEAIARTEKGTEAGKKADEKWSHEFGFIA